MGSLAFADKCKASRTTVCQPGSAVRSARARYSAGGAHQARDEHFEGVAGERGEKLAAQLGRGGALAQLNIEVVDDQQAKT